MSVQRNNKNMGLRDIGATLPPGFRFYPSDEELVCHYLYKKICNDHQVLKGTLVEIDLHTCEPWQLPDVAKLNASEWYFFSFRDRKYATGYRTNRATTSGYWKATGKDRTVIDPVTREVVGMRKTLVFYRNRAPNGIKSGWIMHEFRLETPHMPPKEDWVLCRVFHKSKGSENSTEVLSPQHNNTNLLDNINTSTTSSCVPDPLNLASDHHHHHHQHQTMPNYGYHHDQMTSFNSSSPTHNNNNNNNNNDKYNNSTTTPNGSNSLEHHTNRLHYSSNYGKKLGTNNNIDGATMGNPSSTGTDDYGFLWDMNFEDDGMENHGAPPNFDDMRFEINDSSMVFL